MAVKTDFTKNDFIKILSAYDLGKLQDFKPIAQGAVQTNFILETTKGRFVFRYYENRTLGSVLFESELIKYLRDHHYPCPSIISNKHGEYVGEHNGKPYLIFEFVEGEHLENPNEAQKRALIEKVAELQNMTRNYVPIHKNARWNYSVELAKKLAKKETEKIGTSDAREKLNWFKKALSSINLPDNLPKGICHCDFHFSNILFKNGEFTALIDFDDANYTFLTYDLATLIDPFISSFDWDSWSKFKRGDNVFDFTEAKRIVGEYMNYRELSQEEKEQFFDVFKLSIMFDCIWYFERGDANDFYEKRKIECLDNLGRNRFMKELFD